MLTLLQRRGFQTQQPMARSPPNPLAPHRKAHPSAKPSSTTLRHKARDHPLSLFRATPKRSYPGPWANHHGQGQTPTAKFGETSNARDPTHCKLGNKPTQLTDNPPRNGRLRSSSIRLTHGHDALPQGECTPPIAPSSIPKKVKFPTSSPIAFRGFSYPHPFHSFHPA